MKIDRYLKDLSDRLGISSNDFSSSSNDDDDNHNSGRWCVHCDEIHYAYYECREALFGEGDYWCEACRRVHYAFKNEKMSFRKIG